MDKSGDKLLFLRDKNFHLITVGMPNTTIIITQLIEILAYIPINI